MTLIYDIETGPLPDDEILRVMGEFDPDSVKIGNRGPDKAEEYIEEKRASYLDDLRDKAALSPLTGEVLCIGLWSKGPGAYVWPSDSDEFCLLLDFWHAVSKDTVTLGFNNRRFDLPFLIKRSWLFRIELDDLTTVIGSQIDLLQRWQCGDNQASVNLDTMARFLLGHGKLDDFDAKYFYKYWAEEREKAIEYVRRDVEITAKCAEVLGEINP